MILQRQVNQVQAVAEDEEEAVVEVGAVAEEEVVLQLMQASQVEALAEDEAEAVAEVSQASQVTLHQMKHGIGLMDQDSSQLKCHFWMKMKQVVPTQTCQIHHQNPHSFINL